MRSARTGIGWDIATFECEFCGPRPHTFHAEHGEYNEVYELKCESCGTHKRVPRHDWLSQLSRDHIRPSRASLTKWPYIDMATGVEVKSKEHRAEVWKQHGMHEAPHGINERYSDTEECHNLNRKRIEHEKKMRERDERLKYRGKQPVFRR